MTQADQTIGFSYSPDGTPSLERQEAIPDGELWYVDDVSVTSDGAGSDTTLSVEFGVWNESVTPTAGNTETQNGNGGFATTIDGSVKTQINQSVDVYASDLEELIFEDAQATSDGATLSVAIRARQVL